MTRIAARVAGRGNALYRQQPPGGGPAVGGHEGHGHIQAPTTDIKFCSQKALLVTSGLSRQFATLFAHARRRLRPTSSASGRANR
jgi:hypothetical protein